MVSLLAMHLRGDQANEFHDDGQDLLTASVAAETQLMRLVLGEMPMIWDQCPTLPDLGCHAMPALQHLTVLLLAWLLCRRVRLHGAPAPSDNNSAAGARR
jgi:hypothetical protein